MRRYSIRWLRYWFVCQLLQAERARQQRQLAVCEIGIGSGQMLRFMNVVSQPVWSRWDGVDCLLLRDDLNALGYGSLIDANLQTDTIPGANEYDVFILLHILEHLYEPEKAMTQLERFHKFCSRRKWRFPSNYAKNNLLKGYEST